MNRIYQTIWNKATGTYVAVSELASNSGGGQATAARGAEARFAGFCVKALSAALLLALGTMSVSSVAYAGTDGGNVTNGAAQISRSGATTTINQTSQNTTINWQSFGINKGETVNFVQPNSDAVALNRVLGNSASAIYGTLNANGKVFLINPNGILFGSGASVNVGGLVASTLNLSDANFMAGKYHFAGTSLASVQNDGAITAVNGGYVALLGAKVSNQGTLIAQMGSVALAGGQDITLDLAGDGLLNVAVNQGAVNALVQNGGLIKAAGGQVLMTAQAAGQLLDTVVNSTGVIEVQTLNAKAGSIKLLGDMHSGTVNVSGTLDASAPQGGNGGAIETSAHTVDVASKATITTAAHHGLTGSWLIDPSDFTIAASGGDITGSALSADLANNSITIQTGTGTYTSPVLYGASGTNGDIFVNDPVSWSANNTLTLNAYRNIAINQSITSTGATGGVALLYGQGATASGNYAVYNVNAPVNLAAGNNFSTTLGSDGAAVNYTVVDSLGVQGDATTAPATMTLQGITNGWAGHYVLGANIDAIATSTWNSGAGFTPIGNSTTNFTGTFDGLGHTISHLTIDRPSDFGVGLFGYTGPTSLLRNVGMVDGSVAGYGDVGGLAGYKSGGTISNSYATGAVSGRTNVGGLVGINNGGAISNSYATGAVSGNNTVGGLVGDNFRGTISASYATGAVSGDYIGGLVGTNYFGTISTSYATGAVAGSSIVGGLVGYNYGGAISTSYATGAVSGSNNVGGLVAYNRNGGTTSNSYWDITTSGQTASAGGAGLTTTQMQTASNFSGFAFTTTPGATGNNWVMVDTDGSLNNYGGVSGATFPMLASEYSTTINNAHQLQLMAMNLAGSYTLGSDITASNTATAAALNDVWSTTGGFVPVGTSTAPFTGTFDGLGHTISNLTIYLPSTNCVGLFGLAGSTSVLRNVGMVGGSVTGSQYGGGLAGYNNGTISNSYTTGAVSGGSGSWNIGGLVGLNNRYNTVGTISNSYATGPVSGANRVGGLVGLNNGGTISNSYATGAVSGTIEVGGLMGRNTSTNSGIGTISNSYATGAVSGTTDVGGLVGTLYTSTISNSYATGVVTGTKSVGGLVGYDVNYSTISNSYATGAVSGSNYVGGLAGWVGGGGITFSNNYATGGVSGGTNVGGLVGYNSNSTISNSYWDTSTNSNGLAGIGGGTRTGATGYTTAQMQSQSSFTGFDFTTTPVWGMVSGKNNNMPVLCVFSGCVPSTTTVYIDFLTGSSTYGTAPAFTYSIVNSSGSVISLTNASTGGTAGYSSSAPTASSSVGSYNFSYLSGLSLSGAGASSYTLAPYATATSWTVNPVLLAVTANSASKTYGDALPALGLSYSGFVNGDTINSLTTAATVATTATASSGVGNYATTASGAVDSNYTFGYTTGTLTINPALLAVTANSASKTYGDALPALGLSYSGFVNGDTATSLSTAATAATTATASSSVGNYATTASGAVDGNYTFGYTAGTLTVNPALLAVTANSASKTYGDALPALGLSYSGFVNGDTATSLTTAATAATTANARSGVGSYATTASGAVDSNYTFGYTAGTLTVNPALLAVTANSASKTYGDALPTLGLSYSGFINGDTATSLTTAATVATTATASSGVGNYATTASGAVDSNYTFGYTTGTLTINPALLAVTANSASKTYGDALPALGLSYSGFVNGDTAASLSTAATAATNANARSNVGSYATTASGAADPNYVFNYVDGVLRVNPASQTLPLASAYGLTTTERVDGSTMAGDDTATGTQIPLGPDVGIKLSANQSATLDLLHLRVVNNGIKLPNGWNVSQASNNTL